MRSLDSSKRDPVFRIGLMIVALTLMTAAGFLLLYYKSELDAKNTAEEVGVIRQMLLEKVRLERLRTGTAVTSADVQTMKQGSFVFDVPATWIPQPSSRQDVSVMTFFEGGNQVAEMRCPIPDAGFEIWRFETLSRSLSKNGREIFASLQLGTPMDEGTSEIVLLDLSVDDGSESCKMVSSHNGLFETYKRIYQSVR